MEDFGPVEPGRENGQKSNSFLKNIILNLLVFKRYKYYGKNKIII